MNEIKNIPDKEAPGAPVQGSANPARRILVVEDDADIRRLSADILVRSGYKVDTAEDGAAAWEAIQQSNYDLLVTDNNMPNLTGVELIEKLNAGKMALPVIMATGELPHGVLPRHPGTKPVPILLKPYSRGDLVELVLTTLGDTESSEGTTGSLTQRDAEENPLPRTRPPAAAPPSPMAPRILVVDPDRDLRLMYKDALANPGCQIDVEVDGAAGWDALQANRYDLLITENELPKMTGIELVEKMRSASITVPVVMAAAISPAFDPTRNPSFQPIAILLKPFTLDALQETVRVALGVVVLIAILLLGLPGKVQAQVAAQASVSRTGSTNGIDQPNAVTLSVLGKCEYSQDGVTFTNLDHGQAIDQGAVVRTGEDSQADLFFRRTGTTVRLQAATEIKIEKLKVTMKEGLPRVNTLIDLRSGRIFTVVRSTVAGSTMEIRNAAGRAVVEGSGIGRYIITADGTHVSDSGSAIPLKLIRENGITVISAGQLFDIKDGAMLPATNSDWVKELIELDEMQAASN